jgi:hypothetical protein
MTTERWPFCVGKFKEKTKAELRGATEGTEKLK